METKYRNISLGRYTHQIKATVESSGSDIGLNGLQIGQLDCLASPWSQASQTLRQAVQRDRADQIWTAILVYGRVTLRPN